MFTLNKYSEILFNIKVFDNENISLKHPHTHTYYVIGYFLYNRKFLNYKLLIIKII